MRMHIFGKDVVVTDALRDIVEEKLGKLDKYFTKDTTIEVTLCVNKNEQKVEVTIPLKGKIIRVEESSDDMYASIDMVEEAVERRLSKYKGRLVDRKKAGSREEFSSDYIEEDDENLREDDEVNIVRTKRFGIKPMDPEEACVEMELLGHDFFVFLNADTEEVNVVYKRKNGTYGLIEPELS